MALDQFIYNVGDRGVVEEKQLLKANFPHASVLRKHDWRLAEVP